MEKPICRERQSSSSTISFLRASVAVLSAVVAEQDAVRGHQHDIFIALVAGQDFTCGFACYNSFLVPYFSSFVFSFPSIFACCSMSSQKVLFSLNQLYLFFFCLRLKTWASPDPYASVSSLAQATEWSFVISFQLYQLYKL